MNNFKEYDNAAAKYYNSLEIKTLPILSWDFSHVFGDEIKNFSLDINKINNISLQGKWGNHDWDVKSRMNDDVVIVTDAKLRIVFASNNIVKMNGYKESEVLGNSPKMFHGKDTCLKISSEIREAVEQQIPFDKTVLNYKKNGETYLCHIKGFPVFNKKGKLINFIAFERVA